MQIKTTLRSTSPLLEQPSSKTPPTTDVGEDVRKNKPGTLLLGMHANVTTLENNVRAS
jgi:hypothetical protein